ncbi:MAG: hypothetical protein JSV49_06100 [Thermoplasmata archaeon]|nr:MAG: hypothetical protein JSV49_06100 [Thermoplasmata archaeon]
MQVASLLDLGREAYQKESYDLAIKYYNRALDIDPTHKEAKFLKRKTMMTLTRLLEGKSKIEDDDEVDRELDKAVTKELEMGVGDKEDRPVRRKPVTTAHSPAHKAEKRDRPRIYQPPPQDPRRGTSRVYSIPDTDRKYETGTKRVAYRSGDAYLETKESRYLILILALFLVGVFFISVYLGWITF